MKIEVKSYAPHIGEWLQGGSCEAEGCTGRAYYKITTSGSDDPLYNRNLTVCAKHKSYLLRVMSRQARKEGKEIIIVEKGE